MPSFSRGSTVHVEYTSTPALPPPGPFLGFSICTALQNSCCCSFTCAWRSLTERSATSLGRSPRAEQGGSSSTRSKDSSQKPCTCSSPSSPRLAFRRISCGDFHDGRPLSTILTEFMQRGEMQLMSSSSQSFCMCTAFRLVLSQATTVPLSSISWATWVALPPGALHRSQMVSPARGSRAWATTMEGRFWAYTRLGRAAFRGGASPVTTSTILTARPLLTRNISPRVRSITPRPMNSLRWLYSSMSIPRVVLWSKSTYTFTSWLGCRCLLAAMTPGANTSLPLSTASPQARSTTTWGRSSHCRRHPDLPERGSCTRRPSGRYRGPVRAVFRSFSSS
mmetsp:Transcript_3280/g.4806  ORF Transcript_3280/g.4806 Transcript_3280/m.4806 type:complete len:336 (+) Transcript_3280:336-1343(+)